MLPLKCIKRNFCAKEKKNFEKFSEPLESKSPRGFRQRKNIVCQDERRSLQRGRYVQDDTKMCIILQKVCRFDTGGEGRGKEIGERSKNGRLVRIARQAVADLF